MCILSIKSAKRILLFLALSLFISLPCEAVEQNVKSGSSSFWEDFANFFLPHVEKRNVLFEKQTQYFLVTVEEGENGWRHLVFKPRKGAQGIWNPAAPDEIITSSCKNMAVFVQMANLPPKRVLFIGLGSGIVPRFVRKHFSETIIDIAEIDGEIPGIAEKYFGFKTDARTNIIIGDARDYINRTQEKYDAIIIDAYNADCIPFQLTTEEFYRKVRRALVDDGIMNVNVANLGKPKFIAGELKTVKTVFPELAVFVCSGQTNYMLFAQKNRQFNISEQKEREITELCRQNPELNLTEIIATRMPEDELHEIVYGANVFTDDFAPVETMK
ncbi:MAG: fused MFS/spermidine synthase [Victivallaceae bacterium]